MYSIKLEPSDKLKPVIDRSMSSNAAIELIPVMVQICKAEFSMVDPVAVYMGDNVYHIFDILRPLEYAKISIVKNAN